MTPEAPVYLGRLPTQTRSSTWRSIKVYADHAFVVSEAGDHGMQVFSLARLRAVASPPVVFTADAHYPGFSNAHNVVIDETSGFAYAVGTNTCAGGLHMVDIRAPKRRSSRLLREYAHHDAQCCRPRSDTLHRGRRSASRERDTLTMWT